MRGYKERICLKKIDEGGLNMINIREFQNSFYMEWALKYVREDNESWKRGADVFLLNVGRQQAFRSNVNEKEFKGINLVVSPFWKKTLTLWLKYKNNIESRTSQNESKGLKLDINTPIFNNKNIRFKGNVIFLPHCISRNITTIGDVIDIESGEILTLSEYQEVHGKSVNDVFDHNIIYNAIKNSGFEISCDTDDAEIRIGNEKVEKLDRKKFMKMLYVNKTIKGTTKHTKWMRKFDIEVWDLRYWDILKKAKLEPRLLCLHWKILHNIYPTAYALTKMKIQRDDKCERCGEVETIEHFFYECPSLSNLWKEAKQLIQRETNSHMKINERDILIGIVEKGGFDRDRLDKINHIIIVAKHSIAKVNYGESINYLKTFEIELIKRGIN